MLKFGRFTISSEIKFKKLSFLVICVLEAIG